MWPRDRGQGLTPCPHSASEPRPPRTLHGTAHSGRRGAISKTIVWIVAVLVAGAGRLAAQPSSDGRPTLHLGSVSGTVVAAATNQPLAGAVAVLEAVGDAVLVSRSGGAYLVRSLTAVTDDSGAYRFDGLPPGTYRLLVRQLGYHPAEVTVE